MRAISTPRPRSLPPKADRDVRGRRARDGVSFTGRGRPRVHPDQVVPCRSAERTPHDAMRPAIRRVASDVTRFHRRNVAARRPKFGNAHRRRVPHALLRSVGRSPNFGNPLGMTGTHILQLPPSSGLTFDMVIRPEAAASPLAQDMIVWAVAEAQRRTPDADVIRIQRRPRQPARLAVLRNLGFRQMTTGTLASSYLPGELDPADLLPPGFICRGLTAQDLPSRVQAHTNAFPGEAKDVSDYERLVRCERYEPFLDLVVVDETEQVAAFSTAWLDRRYKAGLFARGHLYELSASRPRASRHVGRAAPSQATRRDVGRRPRAKPKRCRNCLLREPWVQNRLRYVRLRKIAS